MTLDNLHGGSLTRLLKLHELRLRSCLSCGYSEGKGFGVEALLEEQKKRGPWAASRTLPFNEASYGVTVMHTWAVQLV
jgi:hypothetical protein